MINSSLFSSDESSPWDPKVLRKLLYISEDQLNILSNIPGWSKASYHANTLRLEKEIAITENSQSSQFQLVTTQNSQTNNQNFKLSDDNLLAQANTLKPYKVSRSVSLNEIDKIGKNLPDDKSLKRVVSLPLLFKSSSNSCVTSDGEIVFREKYSGINSVLSLQILPEVSTLEQRDTDSAKLESVTKSTSAKMSTVCVIGETSNNMNTQLQVVQNVSSNESRVQLVEKMNLVPAFHATETLGNLIGQPENISGNIEKVVSNKSVVEVSEKMNVISEASGNVNNEPIAIISSVVSLNNGKSTVQDKEHQDNVVESSENKLGSCIVEETAPDIAKDKMNLNSETLTEINETRTQILEPVKSAPEKQPTLIENLISDNQKLISSESSEDKLGSCIIKETATVDNSSSVNAATKDKMDSNSEILTEINETCTEVLKSVKSVPQKQPTLNENLISNNQKHSILDKPFDSESSEGKLGSCIIKETASANITSSVNAATKDEMGSNSGKITEIRETSTEDLYSFNTASKEQRTGVKNLLPNIQKYSDLLNARMEIPVDPKVSQEINLVPDKSAAEKRAVPEKRKLSGKIKSSKRHKSSREKPGSVDVRSLKRAGDIHFTDEDTKDMINIIKCFL